MLVDVVELRCRGVKRAREDVLAAEPVRGLLSLSPGRPGWHSGTRNPPLMAGVVRPGLSEWAMPPLDQARVTTIKSGSLLGVGLQEVRLGHEQGLRDNPWMQLLIQAEGTSEIDRQRGIAAARRVFERGNATASECALAASLQASGNPGTSRLAALWKDAEKAALAASCERLSTIPAGACLELRFGDSPRKRSARLAADDLAPQLPW